MKFATEAQNQALQPEQHSNTKDKDDENSVSTYKRKRSDMANGNKSDEHQSNNQNITNVKKRRLSNTQHSYIRENAAVKLQRTWRNYRINKMIATGTINDSLYIDQVQSHFPGLNVDPELPKQESTIDQVKATNYLSNIANPGTRKVAKDIIDNRITYLSTNDLINGVTKSIKYLNKFLENQNVNTEMSLLIEPDHSSAWVAGIAARYMNAIPKKIIQSSRFHLSQIEIAYNSNNVASIIYIDDFTISGMQLQENINKIAIKHSQNCDSRPYITDFEDFYNKFGKKFILGNPKQLNIYIAIPFMNDYAVRSICDYIDSYSKLGINIVIFKPKLIPNLYKALSSDEYWTLSQLNDNDLKCGKQALVFSSWKKPDYVSMPGYFAKGILPEHLKSKNSNNSDCEFIPYVKPPY